MLSGSTHVMTDKILPYMDTIVVLDGGKIVRSGAFGELRQSGPGLIEDIKSNDTSTEEVCRSSNDMDTSTQPNLRSQTIKSQTDASLEFSERQDGSWSVYTYYCRSVGTFSMIAWAISLFLGAVCNGVSSRLHIQ